MFSGLRKKKKQNESPVIQQEQADETNLNRINLINTLLDRVITKSDDKSINNLIKGLAKNDIFKIIASASGLPVKRYLLSVAKNAPFLLREFGEIGYKDPSFITELLNNEDFLDLFSIDADNNKIDRIIHILESNRDEILDLLSVKLSQDRDPTRTQDINKFNKKLAKTEKTIKSLQKKLQTGGARVNKKAIAAQLKDAILVKKAFEKKLQGAQAKSSGNSEPISRILPQESTKIFYDNFVNLLKQNKDLVTSENIKPLINTLGNLLTKNYEINAIQAEIDNFNYNISQDPELFSKFTGNLPNDQRRHLALHQLKKRHDQLLAERNNIVVGSLLPKLMPVLQSEDLQNLLKSEEILSIVNNFIAELGPNDELAQTLESLNIDRQFITETVDFATNEIIPNIGEILRKINSANINIFSLDRDVEEQTATALKIAGTLLESPQETVDLASNIVGFLSNNTEQISQIIESDFVKKILDENLKKANIKDSEARSEIIGNLTNIASDFITLYQQKSDELSEKSYQRLFFVLEKIVDNINQEKILEEKIKQFDEEIKELGEEVNNNKKIERNQLQKRKKILSLERTKILQNEIVSLSNIILVDEDVKSFLENNVSNFSQIITSAINSNPELSKNLEKLNLKAEFVSKLPDIAIHEVIPQIRGIFKKINVAEINMLANKPIEQQKETILQAADSLLEDPEEIIGLVSTVNKFLHENKEQISQIVESDFVRTELKNRLSEANINTDINDDLINLGKDLTQEILPDLTDLSEEITRNSGTLYKLFKQYTEASGFMEKISTISQIIKNEEVNDLIFNNDKLNKLLDSSIPSFLEKNSDKIERICEEYFNTEQGKLNEKEMKTKLKQLMFLVDNTKEINSCIKHFSNKKYYPLACELTNLLKKPETLTLITAFIVDISDKLSKKVSNITMTANYKRKEYFNYGKHNVFKTLRKIRKDLKTLVTKKESSSKSLPKANNHEQPRGPNL